MAPRTATLQPSADIHLVLQPPARATLQLDAMLHDDAIAEPASIRAASTFAIADSAIAEVSAGGVLTPKAEGRTFLTVEHSLTSGHTVRIVARVSVHSGISKWWIGNNHASVHAGEADLLLSAYAVFDDGNIGDITNHGYVVFTAPGTNASVTAAGRVTGVSAGDITIHGTLDGIGADVVVTVVPPPSALRPIVEPVRLSGPMAERRNVLLLAEGFVDRGTFVALVQKVVDRLVSSRLHEPFRILRDDVNYWMAFEPSHENGITPGPPVNSDGLMFLVDMPPVNPADLTFHQLVGLVGLPEELGSVDRAEADTSLQALYPAYQPALVETGIFDYWQTWEGKGIPQARDSRYGLMYGARPGDREFTADPQQADNSWYFHPLPPQSLPPDPRRSPPNVTRWQDKFFVLLGSLRTKQGAGDPNHVIGPRWARDGDDQALVFFLCNDECFGAFANREPPVYSAAAIDLKDHFSKIAIRGGTNVLDHEPDTSGALIEALVATVAHELGHQFFLGDEYESADGKQQTVDLAHALPIELDDNLTTKFILVTGTPPTLDPDRIKWKRLFRIARASRTAGAAVDGPGANIHVPLAPGEGKKWKSGDPVILRTRNINAATTINDAANVPLYKSYPLYRAHPLHQREAQVEAVAGDVVTVSGGKLAADEAFPPGSTLYIPKQNKAGTAPLRLVLPGVGDFMKANHGPLVSKGQCTQAVPQPPQPCRRRLPA